MNDHEHLLDLIPAYALDALDAEERAALEARLAVDAAARQLLAEYEQVAGQLALTAVPVQPVPPGLTDDLRRLVRSRAAAKPGGRRRLWAAVAAAAAILLILAVVLRTPPAADPAGTFASLQAQADAHRLPLQAAADVAAALTGELVVAPDGSQAVIRVSDLPAIRPDQTFQLWLRDVDGQVVSGGLFQASGDADTYLAIPLAGRPADQFAAFGVSLEPAGGSPFPDRRSGPRVFSVALDQEF